MEFTFNREENKEKIEQLEFFLKEHKDMPGPLMPALQEVQNIFGYLPREMMELVSKRLNVPVSDIYGVATFYAQFSFIPKGKHNISVCMGTACYVRGSQAVLDRIESELGIKVGETTADGKFSITETRCLGACGLAPVITVGEEVHGKLTPDDIPAILNKYRDA